MCHLQLTNKVCKVITLSEYGLRGQCYWQQYTLSNFKFGLPKVTRVSRREVKLVRNVPAHYPLFAGLTARTIARQAN